MSKEVAFAAAKLGMQGVKTSGILFYGGEPLLERQLIYDTVEYTKQLKAKTGHNFYYKVTTNGTLLDEEFINFAKEHNIVIGFSHDGPVHDVCRLFNDGKPSYEVLQEKFDLVLKELPYTISMSVTDPETVHRAAEMVEFAFNKGFRYIHLSHNYDRKAPWTNEHLEILKKQYKKMAELYIKWTRAEEKFYLSPFDAKILSHLKGSKYNIDRIRMAQNQPSVNCDGKIYFSSKYLDNPVFQVGDVFKGIDKKKQRIIYEKSFELSKTCLECAIKERCNYAYDSLVCDTSDPNDIYAQVAPMQCSHEQIVTPIADYAAEKLYKDKSALFIQKHYNELYPVMSLIEDMNK
jgi:uncharacterized protein